MNLFKSMLTFYMLYSQRSAGLTLPEKPLVLKDPVGTDVCAKWEDIQRAISEQNYQVELRDADDFCRQRQNRG